MILLTISAEVGQARFCTAADSFTAVLIRQMCYYFEEPSIHNTNLAVEMRDLAGLMVTVYGEQLSNGILGWMVDSSDTDRYLVSLDDSNYCCLELNILTGSLNTVWV